MSDATLLSHLQQQVTNLESLTAMLDAELGLISARNPEALMKLVEEKQQLLDLITSTDQSISQASQYADIENSQVVDTQARVKKLIEECRYRSEINEKAVEQGQLRLTHLRQMILEARAKESMTYDKSGKASGGSRGKGYTA